MTDTETPMTPDDGVKKANWQAAIQKGQEKMREMREAGWKPVHRNPVEQAREKPNSTKAAIKAYCWLCNGADADPGAKYRVRDCTTGPRCPLYAHRPWQNIKGGIGLNAEGVLEPTTDSENTADE